MPKLKAPPDKWKDFKVLVSGTMQINGVNCSDVAAWLGCHRTTVYRKLDSPWLMPMGEMITLSRRLGIPADTMRAAIPFN